MIENFFDIDNNARIEQKNSIANIMSKYNVTLSGIAKTVGFDHTLLIRWKQGKTIALSAQTIAKINKAFPMMQPLDISNEKPHDDFSEQSYDKKVTNDDVLVPYYDMKLSAGYGLIAFENAEEPEEVLRFSKHFMSKLGAINKNNITAVDVAGDSMSPSIHDGDMIFIDSTSHNLVSGHIYALAWNDEYMIKRVIKNPSNKTYTLVSDNKVYPPFENVPPNELRIIGRALLKTSKLL